MLLSFFVCVCGKSVLESLLLEWLFSTEIVCEEEEKEEEEEDDDDDDDDEYICVLLKGTEEEEDICGGREEVCKEEDDDEDAETFWLSLCIISIPVLALLLTELITEAELEEDTILFCIEIVFILLFPSDFFSLCLCSEWMLS